MRMDGFKISNDELLATFVPILVYWVYSGTYAVLGSYFEGYRLNTKQEEDENNLVPKGTVVKGILLQQIFRAVVTTLFYKIPAGYDVGTAQQPSLIALATQFIVAMWVMTTYQYFVHRSLHQNKFLYKHIHRHHHKMVVPYAYGAMYNHPLEALLLDMGSGALAVFLSGMSPRTSMFFMSLTTMKTVDDHCGLWLPGNPFHFFFYNNTAYHYIHHQLYGGKYNFSAPFFNMWDRILGTHMPYSVEKKACGGFEVRAIKQKRED